MTEPHYHGHRQRLRERLAKDSTALADYELLELLLAQTLPRRDTKPLAKALLARFGTLHGAIYAPQAQLAEVSGIGPATLTAWTLLRELWARMQEAKLRSRETLSTPDIVADAARARFGSGSVEELWAAFLDNQNRAIAWERITQGSVGSIGAEPRAIMAPALKHEAPRVILVHNHPGGSAWPSEEDKFFTIQVVRAGSGVGVEVVDHIIITEMDYYSFQEHGLMG